VSAVEELRRIARESVEESVRTRKHVVKVFEERAAARGWKVESVNYYWRKAKRESWVFVVNAGGAKYVVEVTCPRARLPLGWFLNETEISVVQGGGE